MKSRELGALLNLLAKHPRVASLTIGDVTVSFHDGSPPVERIEAPPPEPEAEPDIPEGVYDPRKRLTEIHRKYKRPS